MKKLRNFIGGELVAPRNQAYLDSFDPAIGSVYATVPASDEQDVAAAITAAAQAFPAWSGLPAEQRARCLMQLADQLEHNQGALALAECIDTGKPLALAQQVDIPRAIQNFRFFATALLHLSSEAHQTDSQALNYTLRQPLGAVACISPWNLPLYLLTWKIAPALAAGNCVVAKPSEVTPMTAYLLSEICASLQLPPGVLNIVHGTGRQAGTPLVVHPRIRAVSFTGGTQTGADISCQAAPLFKKLSLEMGGKNPNIVFADCDYEEALTESLRAAFSNQGQICLCGSRLFIERPLYERFRADFVERAKALRVGDPLSDKSQQGAIVSQAHLAKILSYVELARQEGGTLLCGGRQVQLEGRCQGGWFMEPTVIEGLSPQCRTNQEEIFGPVVTLMPFDSEDEVVSAANSVRYGLAASLWTRDLTRAHRLAARLESGVIWVNCWMLRDLRTPFGGFKDSGLGREGGWEIMRFFTEAKNVCVRL